MMSKLDTNIVKVLESSSKFSKVNCIVFLDNYQTSLLHLKKNNIKIINNLPFINAVELELDKSKLTKIINYDFVKYVSSQVNVSALMNIAKKVLQVDNSFSGEGVTIAYIDTGISPHLDFMLGKKRIIKFIDLINYKLFPYDDNGHGTFVAGVGSGNGFLSGGKFTGIAPKSNIISVKALNKEGEANSGKILEAMQWVYDNAFKYKIKVVCMSFGSEPLGFKDPIMRGAEELWKKNITVVAAAGNSGPDYETIKSPGVSPQVITVGGFNDNRIDENTYNENFFEIAEFSSRGPALKRFKPDVIAPSVNIHSCGVEKPYTTLSGTSVATPMIAGICALCYEINPNIEPNVLKKIIMMCSKAITYNNNVEGFGIPNAEIICSKIITNYK